MTNRRMDLLDLCSRVASVRSLLCASAFLLGDCVMGAEYGRYDDAPSPTVEAVVSDAEEASLQAASLQESTALETVSEEPAAYATTTEPLDLEAMQKKLEELQATTAAFKEDLDAQKNKDKNKKPNDPYTVKWAGRLAFDGTFVSESEDARTAFGEADNSFRIRDLRITGNASGHGKLAAAWGVALQGGQATLLHNYLKVKDTRLFGDVTVGHFFVESGMQSVQTSFDREFVTIDEDSSAFGLGRRLGVSSAYHTEDKRGRAFFGCFLPKAINTGATGHAISDDNMGVVLNTRLTYAPLLLEDENGRTLEALHVGGSYYGVMPHGSGDLNFKTSGLGWKNGPNFFDATVDLNGRNYGVSQVEAAWQRGGFGASAEGYVLSVNDGGGEAYGTTIQMRWLLAPNCSRTYVKEDGHFGGVKMNDDLVFLSFKDRTIGHNFGVLEPVAKWEWMQCDHLNNTKTTGRIGTVNRVVTGANWFLNEQTYVTLNWEHAFVDTQNVKALGEDADANFDTIVVQTTLKF